MLEAFQPEGGAEKGPAGGESARPLLLGMGGFPDEPGGLNRYLHELHAALCSQGVAAAAVVLGPVSKPAPGVRVVGSRNDRLHKRLLRYTIASRDAAQLADVVDAHFALYAFLPVVLRALRGRPLVSHFHGPWSDESRSSGERWASRLTGKRFVERVVYRRAQEIVVLSSAFKRIAVERYRVSPWRVTVIAPGVDLAHFTAGPSAALRAKLGLPANRPIALTVRRLVPRMGIDILLEAWSAVTSEIPGALLVIAGEGPCRLDLERTAARLGIDESVRFAGRVSEDDLRDLYRAVDVCVVPSVALEGFGLVVLEALACGTPVVVTDAGGLPEAVRPFDRGLVVSAGKPDALAQRLRSGLDGSSPFPSPERCREYAQRFSWDEAARKHQQIYAHTRAPRKHGLRVVYLNHCAKLSGGELALLRLLSALEGVEPHVVLAENGPLVARLLEAGISVEVMPMSESARDLPRTRVRPDALRMWTIVQSAAYTLRLAHRIRQLRPDLVHTNSLKSALYGGVAARVSGTPVVWHIRDRVAEDYLPAPAVRLVRRAARWLPDAVIANSYTTLATLGDNLPERAVISGPVIYDPVAPSRVGSHGARRGLTVGIVGRIAPWKGQHLFLEAFARAFANGDERGVIIGAPLFGEHDYDTHLRTLCSELGLDGRVDFHGFRDDVEEELAQLDILVHASVVPEPFGQVVVEGMAAGLPVVAPSVGGPAEVIEDRATGLLYRAGDAQALASVLVELSRDAQLRERLGAAARVRAGDFAPELIGPRVVRVYRHVLEPFLLAENLRRNAPDEPGRPS